ncbi:MAG: anti-sigma factor antagonist [Anaerolineae bacterium]|nr:MAG: anti-sigma factor antagonist [Anaerolineae bacterium]
MEMKLEMDGTVAIVIASGSIDALTAPELANFINLQIQDGHTRLVADLAGVDYTSSAGLRVLLGAVKETRSKGGDLRLANIQPDVKKVLDLSGFTSILKHFPDRAAAIASYNG